MTLLLNLFFFLLPWQTRWIFESGIRNGLPWEWGTLAITVVEVVLWLAVVVRMRSPLFISPLLRRGEKTNKISSSHDRGEKRDEFPPSSGGRGRMKVGDVIGVALLVILTVIPHSTPVASLHLLDAIVLFLLLWFHPNPRRFIPWFLAGMIPAAALGVVQFMTQHAPGSTLLGLAEHIPWQSGASVVETTVGRWLRAYGPFPHPNIFGGYLAVALVLAVRRRDWARFLAPVFAIALVLTFSRSAWVAVAIGLVTPLSISPLLRRGEKQDEFPPSSEGRGRMKVGDVAPTFVALLLTSLLVLPLIRTRATAVGRLETLSLTTRTASWRRSLDDIRRHPLLGIGLGRGANRGEPVHNVPALALQEIGLMGLIGLIGLIALALRRRALDASLLAVLIVLALLDHYLWSLLPGLLLLTAALGFATLRPSGR